MGRGLVPDGSRAVLAVALASVLVLSVVSPVLAASAAGGDERHDSSENAFALTETVELTETLTATETLTETSTLTETETLNNTTETVDDTTNDTTETLTETVDDTTDDTTDTVDDTTNETVETVDDTTSDTVDNTTDSVEETVNETVNETTDGTNETVDNTTDASDELLTGASSPQTANVAVENATAGEPVTVDVSAADTGSIGVSTLTIVPERDGGFELNVTASDEKLADAPTFTRSDGGVDLGSVRVNHTIKDENITNVTFTFSLSEQRLRQANATPDEISLYRYNNGSWNAVNTTFLYKEGDSYVFRAVSPGLSDFTAAAQKPEFELAKALVEPTSVNVGDNVNIRVRIHNVGDADGSYTAKLLFDGEVVATKQVTIAADGTRQVSFSRMPDKPGTYEVRVNNATAGTLSVAANATATPTDNTSTSSSRITSQSAPGFGLLAPFAALAVLLLLRRH